MLEIVVIFGLFNYELPHMTDQIPKHQGLTQPFLFDY
jgi:hypothetical protein